MKHAVHLHQTIGLYDYHPPGILLNRARSSVSPEDWYIASSNRYILRDCAFVSFYATIVIAGSAWRKSNVFSEVGARFIVRIPECILFIIYS